MQIHMGPVEVMKYNHTYDAVVSADAKGVLEYWCPTTLQFPEHRYVLSSTTQHIICIVYSVGWNHKR